MIEVFPAHEGENLRSLRILFEEYASSLEISLDFQGFRTELEKLPGEYSPPSGRLFIAMWDGKVAGCVALRRCDDEICEMKRLFVRPHYQGLNIGRTLAAAVVAEARTMNYKRMRLDTLPSMLHARSLYASMGFVEIPSYRYNPVDGAMFMELPLV